ncbi:MAG: GNAT family N-acetyltransferase, partial [Chloroflexota bacterium]|nr:GNAT family N-acetyltransferase [Chloroflexota bacterium]
MTALAYCQASTLPLERLTAAFNLGFAGYFLPMEQTPESLGRMIHEVDVRLEDSLALFADGEPAGIGLVAVRGVRGWIAGMGVAPALRGQGVGGELLRQLLIRLGGAGVREVRLEALEANTIAIGLYQKAGFRTLRPLTVYQGPLLRDTLGPPPADDAHVRVATARVALADFAAYHPVAPAWQRELATLERINRGMRGLGLWQAGRLRAYTLYMRQGDAYALLDGGASADDAEARRG